MLAGNQYLSACGLDFGVFTVYIILPEVGGFRVLGVRRAQVWFQIGGRVETRDTEPQTLNPNRGALVIRIGFRGIL